MPLSTKIQPIDAHALPSEGATRPEVKPVMMKSRLKRLLFRISVADKVGADENLPESNKDGFAAGGPGGGTEFEPSSVCLAKMVQNFIEESNEKQSVSSVKCGRNRCNCFNGNGSDSSSDCESENISGADVCDFLKALVVCGNVKERNVLAETAKIIDKNNKTCKRKDELRKMVSDGLVGLGYDASICISKWDKSPSFPAGEYEYVDVIFDGGERLIIDVDFRSEFEIARSTKTYKSILQTLPYIFVGKSDRLSKIITIVSEAAKQSLKRKGMHFPPWRKADYVKAKWLSPHHNRTRSVTTEPTPIPPPSPPPLQSPVKSSHGVEIDDGDSKSSSGDDDEKAVREKVTQLAEAPSDISGSSPESEPVFEMSESSGEEDGKVLEKEKTDVNRTAAMKVIVRSSSKKSGIGVSSSTGLATIMVEYP